MTKTEKDPGAAAALAESPPEWLARLRADPGPAALGITWLDPGDIRADGGADETVFDGIMYSRATREYIDRHRPHMVRVASGPGYVGGFGLEHEAAWYVDTRDPDRPLLAPNVSYPPFLWIPAEEASTEGMRRAMEGLFPSTKPVRATLPKTSRGFMGYADRMRVPNVYSGEFVPIDGLELDRYYTMNTFTEGCRGAAILDRGTGDGHPDLFEEGALWDDEDDEDYEEEEDGDE
ncbi:hypothetical protein ACFY4C_32125 [Actinomadura viridis]|uniref:hypothetical protein n=1 Tax=Actinomadura viridis TaxID=58110 RepID=UPI003699041B